MIDLLLLTNAFCSSYCPMRSETILDKDLVPCPGQANLNFPDRDHEPCCPLASDGVSDWKHPSHFHTEEDMKPDPPIKPRGVKKMYFKTRDWIRDNEVKDKTKSLMTDLG